MKKIYFLAIVGPTASGKSKLAIDIAQKIDGVIISMDSMQIYREFNIGTAKISDSEKQNIIHEMIDIKNPDESFTVSDYVNAVIPLLKKYNHKKKMPIFVGGTALYLKSLIYDYSLGNAVIDDSFRNKMYELASTDEGKEQLFHLLCEIDLETAIKLHKNDVKRIVRALEVFHITGKKFSSQNNMTISNNYEFKIIGLNCNRDLLYQRINERVDQMMAFGLEDEVKDLYEKYALLSCQAMQSIGYKEFENYFLSKQSLDETINQIKQNSRRYAKRQLTFFKSFEKIHWIERENYNDILDETEKIINESGFLSNFYEN